MTVGTDQIRRIAFCRTARAILAAIGLWLAAPAVASASCGDYLDHAGSSAGRSSQFAAIDGRSDLTTEASSDVLPTGPVRPCRGPLCQAAPDRPNVPAAPPAPSTGGGPEHALTAHAASPPRDDSGERLRVDDGRARDVPAPPVERPPRFPRVVARAV